MLTFGVRNINIANQLEAYESITGIGSDSTGCSIMTPKAVHRVLKITGLRPEQANIIKQQILSCGGEAAVTRGTVNSTVESTCMLIMGTINQFDKLVKKLYLQPFNLKSLAAEIKEVLAKLEGRKPYSLDCRGKKIDIGVRTLVMGILNITPDSFSDGGQYIDPEKAVERAKLMVEEGADIIDVGGESTRPGHTPVSLEEELQRVIPVLEVLSKQVNVPVSIDTYKAEVARKALDAGANIINDQWALRADKEMAKVVAQYNVPVILMHNKSDNFYEDLIGDMVDYFREGIEKAVLAGLPREKVILDPGIGFGKDLEQNLQTMNRLKELDCLGQPILLGTSRKSLIGKTLDLPSSERKEGTAATVAFGIANGAEIIRVHDVKEMARVARMTDAMVKVRKEQRV